MPRHRTPREILYRTVRPAIWRRDRGACRHCGVAVELSDCHIDHIVSGRSASNSFSNLRTLCRRCHVLRADMRHRGLVAAALRDGIIPWNWRELVWEG